MNLKIDKSIIHFLTVLLFIGLSSSAQAVCNSAIPLSTPTTDFVDHNDGTVTHSPTGLMWKVCAEGYSWSAGGCATSGAISHHWDDALQVPSTLNVSGGFANHFDWRLPNIKELTSIIEIACDMPAINNTVFPVPGEGYFSASPYVRGIWHAWGVDFWRGNYGALAKTSSRRVRLVRGG